MPPDIDRLRIGHRLIEDGAPTFVIADIDGGIGATLGQGRALVDAAAAAAAAAISLTATGEADPDVTGWAPLAIRAQALGLAVIASPASDATVDRLERIGVQAYRLDSGDITREGLIRRCAQTAKPVLLGTGNATLDDIRQAVRWARDSGAAGVALLHPISPAQGGAGGENLRAVAALGLAGDAVVGVADDSADGFAAPLAVALGASIYARPLRAASGSHPMSTRVGAAATEFALIVRAIVRAEAALGSAWLPFCQTAATPVAWTARSAPSDTPTAHWASHPRSAP
jgi:sialic acid synthase SpsE